MARTTKTTKRNAAARAVDNDFENSGYYEWDGADEDRSVLERLGELARGNPGAALGAGVALIAGAIVGLAWPFVKSNNSPAPKRKQAEKTRQASARKSAKTPAGKVKSTRKTKAGATTVSGRTKRHTSTAPKSGARNSGAPTPARAETAATPGTTRVRKPRSDKGVKRRHYAPRSTASTASTPAS